MGNVGSDGDVVKVAPRWPRELPEMPEDEEGRVLAAVGSWERLSEMPDVIVGFVTFMVWRRASPRGRTVAVRK